MVRTKVAVGQSDDVEAALAVAQVVDQVESRIGRPDAVLAFASVDYDFDEIAREFGRHWGGVPTIGGSMDGTFIAGGGYVEDGVAVLAVRNEQLQVRTALARNLGQDSHAATRRALAAALEGTDGPPDVIWLTPDGLTGNMDAVLRAIRETCGDQTLVLGATTGDHWEFVSARQLHGATSHADSLPMMLWWGGIGLGTGVESGWDPVSDPIEVTAVEANTLLGLDGRPALEVFTQHFGELVREAIGEYPLAVYPDPDSQAFYLRAIYRIDEERGSLHLAGEVPLGATVRLTNVLPQALLDGAARSTATALGQNPDPAGVLVVSCAARKWMLGARVEREMETILAAVGPDLPVLGVYSFGEIAPLGGLSRFHNETCVTLALS